MLDAHVASWPR